MGAIKDIVDLVTDLEARVKDRKTLDMLFPIKQKIIQAETEQLELERKNFRMEREFSKKEFDLKSIHAAEMEKLKSVHAAETAKFKNKIAELESAIKTSSTKKMAQVRIIR